ncbi:MAG: class I SAM-dependent methyltransferase [Rhodobacteraceae bacterium]|nr:class I SAM-dependent methyltransferase [Paracoccaceae bacterium]
MHMSENEFWNKRYQSPGYLFGKEPAQFLKEQAVRLPKAARILCVADGEGRNSAYLASIGHQVTAFDRSELGVAKARALAEELGVSVDYHIADISDWDWSQDYDVVVAIFIQFAAPELRDQILRWLAQAVSPGGMLLLHGYVPRQLEYGTGGPPNAANMYSVEMLESMFAEFEIQRLEDYDREVDEGRGHSGRSALIDLVARKPAKD